MQMTKCINHIYTCSIGSCKANIKLNFNGKKAAVIKEWHGWFFWGVTGVFLSLFCFFFWLFEIKYQLYDYQSPQCEICRFVTIVVFFLIIS